MASREMTLETLSVCRAKRRLGVRLTAHEYSVETLYGETLGKELDAYEARRTLEQHGYVLVR